MLYADKRKSKLDTVDFEGVPQATVARAADVGENFVSNVTRVVARTNIIRDTKSSDFQHAQNQRQSPGVARLGKLALTAMVAARQLRGIVSSK